MVAGGPGWELVLANHGGCRTAKVQKGPTQTVCERPNPLNLRSPITCSINAQSKHLGHADERETRALNKRKKASSMLFVAGQCYWRNNLITQDSRCNVDGAAVCRGGECEKRLGHRSLDGASAGFNSERTNPRSGVKVAAIHSALIEPQVAPSRETLNVAARERRC